MFSFYNFMAIRILPKGMAYLLHGMNVLHTSPSHHAFSWNNGKRHQKQDKNRLVNNYFFDEILKPSEKALILL